MSAPAASAGISDADFYCTSVSGKPAGKPPLTLQPIAGPGKAAPPLRKRQLRAGPPKAPKVSCSSQSTMHVKIVHYRLDAQNTCLQPCNLSSPAYASLLHGASAWGQLPLYIS